MPDAYKPDYKKWRSEFERFHIDKDSILIGHSCGGGFLVRWLTENKIPIKKLVLVAPWLDPERRKTDIFFDFTIDPTITERTHVHILVSNDDDKDIQDSVHTIQKKMPKLNRHNFQNMGHFCYNDMKTEEFPALLDIILKE